MRWLLICLFVSLGVLLVIAAAVARHIWLQQHGSGNQSLGITGPTHSLGRDAADEADVEPEV